MYNFVLHVVIFLILFAAYIFVSRSLQRIIGDRRRIQIEHGNPNATPEMFIAVLAIVLFAGGLCLYIKFLYDLYQNIT